MSITAHKSVDYIRRENRHKRGGTGQPSVDAAERAESPAVAVSLSDLLSREPTPEYAAELSDHLERLLARLDATGDRDLRNIAILKMDGYKNDEAAERIGCVVRTVERKLQLIARLWGKEVES
jgi:DNA-directed RNA polymerase specialized sigma24 family protein